MQILKLNLAQAVFPLFSRSTAKENPDGDILVFRLDDKLGDSIVSTGFLHELKKNFPQNRLVVLCGRNAAFVYRRLKFIDDVIVVRKGFWQTIRAFFILKDRRYRFIFNTSHILTPQVVFLSSVLEAAKKITFLNYQAKSFNHHVHYDAQSDHVTVRYQKALKRVGVDSTQLDYHLVTSDENADKAVAKVVSELHRKAPLIVILNSFAGARLRSLSQKTTMDIVKGILQNHPNVVVVSVGSEDDLKKVQYWVTALNDRRWVCYPRYRNLDFNLALAQHSALIVTPDTSWVHVASALKKNVVAIYREDAETEKNSLIWAPYKTQSAVVYAPFDQQRPNDINTIDPNQVTQQVTTLLQVIS